MDQSLPPKRHRAASFLQLFKLAFSRLVQNDPLRMAGATAFFTSFALPFILIIITQALSLVINPRQLRRELFSDLSELFGRDSVRQIVDTLIAFRQLSSNTLFNAAGFVFLLLVATTLLMVVKGSINQIWRIKVDEDRSFFKALGTRMQSILIILATGFLVVLSIAAEALKAYMSQHIGNLSPGIASLFTSALTYLSSILFVTLWFGIIFRLLPDARPPWRVAFTGAFVTALLFTLGKFLLRVLLIESNLDSLYGTSASIVLILLFVFYSSLIMYFGAAFTSVWADYRQLPIRPLPYACHYKVEEVKEENRESRTDTRSLS